MSPLVNMRTRDCSLVIRTPWPDNYNYNKRKVILQCKSRQRDSVGHNLTIYDLGLGETLKYRHVEYVDQLGFSDYSD